MSAPLTIAVAGGTGKEGRGLAVRMAAAGHRVLVGSRVAERAAEAAADLHARLERAGMFGLRAESGRNCDVLPDADVIFLTVPYAAVDPLLDECGSLLRGKIVVDVTVPLQVVDRRFEVRPPPAGSAGMHVQRRVPEARVVSGFKNVAADHLLQLKRAAVGDVLLAADDTDAKDVVGRLVRDIPALRPVDAGPLVNAGFLESLTALELNLNRLHKTVTSIRILGIP